MDRITKIINKWDPAKLMSHAPDDEYNYEAGKIWGIMNEESDPVKLAYAIEGVFADTFEGDVNCEMETYIKIAKELLANK